MKIALVSDAIYPYNKGGKEKRLYEVSTRLAKKGHEVHIYCMKWWKGNSKRKENGVILHGFSRYSPLYSKNRRSIKQALIFSINSFKLIREDFDVIDVDHMPHLVLFPLKIVSILKRKKMIVTWNEVWGRKYWKEYLGFLGEVAFVVEKLSVITADKIISVSDHTSDRLVRVLNYPKNKIIIVPNGIEFKKIQKIKKSNQESDIIFAGRLLPHKNADVLIKAISEVKKKKENISCFIIGEGTEKNNLKELAKSLGLEKNITFLNFLDKHDDLYALIKASKVFVLPSTREGFGIVVIEANACGIPVVTIDHEHNAAKNLVINGKNGFICKLDKNQVASSINVALLERQSAAFYINSAKKYDWDEITNQIEKIYLNI